MPAHVGTDYPFLSRHVAFDVMLAEHVVAGGVRALRPVALLRSRAGGPTTSPRIDGKQDNGDGAQADAQPRQERKMRSHGGDQACDADNGHDDDGAQQTRPLTSSDDNSHHISSFVASLFSQHGFGPLRFLRCLTGRENDVCFA